jgi:uncharacterized membrane protein
MRIYATEGKARTRAEGEGVQGKANLLGHPLHIVSIAFPVAFWSGAALTDFLAWSGRDPFWTRMSLELILFGNVVGFVACLTGFIDYFTIPLGRKAKAVALWHTVAATITLGCFVGAYALRSGGAAQAGMGFTWAGDLALLIGAYLGSDLVATYALGVRDARRNQPGQ